MAPELRNWEIDLEVMNEGKRGAPYLYPDSLFTFLGFLHVRCGSDFRSLEGFLRKLSEFIPSLRVPDYTTICRRFNTLNLNIVETLDEFDSDGITISIDASGIKVANRGDWIRKVWKIRRGWIKVHLAVEHETKQVVSIQVTNEKVGDSTMFKSVLLDAKKNVERKNNHIKQVNCDGSYDTKENFNLSKKLEITPAIKIRENASSKSKGSPTRAQHVREYKTIGYKEWSKNYNYGKRWDVEGKFSSVKRLMGESVRATKICNMVNEVRLKFLYHNLLTKYDSVGYIPW